LSAERGERLSLLAVHNKTLLLEQQAKRAHERLDELKADTANGFRDLADGLKIVNTALQDLRDWKNRALGWAAAAIFLASLSGAGVVGLIVKASLQSIAAQAAAERNVGPPRK